jgi:uncharacterized protein
MRQIFLLILMFVIGQWLVKALRRADAQNAQRTGAPGGPGSGRTAGNGAAAGHGASAQARAANGPQLPEPMIRCVECGVHAPASDSVVVAGEPFCCAAHAQRHAARPTGRNAR